MAFLKSRKDSDEQSPLIDQQESVADMRKRAKYRLIGAVCLVLVGVIGLPLLFDRQPRPVALDVAIDLPGKADAPAGKEQSTAAALPALTQPAAMPEMVQPPTPAAASASAAAATPAAQTAPSDQPVAPALAVAQHSPAPAKSSADAAPAEPLPQSVPPLRAEKQAVATYHFAVQVGVFSDQTRVRDIRSKLEKAGLKTYVQVIQTKGGPRGVRVRVGPFALKAQALEAVRKTKALDLPADLVTL